MMKISPLIALFVFSIFAVGCGTAEDQNPIPPKPLQQQTKTADPPDTIQTESQDPIRLTATSLGNNQVQFTWSTSENLNSSGGFVIVRSVNPDPTYPENYYFTQSHERRSRIWINVPTGKQYFRICNLISSSCDKYSENIEVTVQ
ncbi:hypothetical protein H6758_04705 [Candidatus Nomurabacteria bacterium]|nr:hypothetical protein [Candidatus Nomurabacteria bacterium]